MSYLLVRLRAYPYSPKLPFRRPPLDITYVRWYSLPAASRYRMAVAGKFRGRCRSSSCSSNLVYRVTKGMSPIIHQLYGLCELRLFFASPVVLSLISFRNLRSGYIMIIIQLHVLKKGIGKAIPLQAWTGSEGSRRLRLPDFKTVGTWRR